MFCVSCSLYTMDALSDTDAMINEANSNFTIDPRLVSSLYAVAMGVLMVATFIANSFIVLHTLFNISLLKQSSAILLFSLAVTNLLMSVLFMPFTLISAAAGHWVFGSTPQQRQGTCSFVAFAFGCITSVSVHSLAAISFDRFLFIVKPMWHKKVMKPWVTWLIVLVLWIVAFISNITPFIGLGQYAFTANATSCLPIWSGQTKYVIFVLVGSTPPLGIIALTTIWTFVFTRAFIRDHYRVSGGGEAAEDDGMNSVYRTKLRKVFGIFGSLLAVNVICFLPFILAGIAGLVVGFSNFPTGMYAAVLYLFLLNNVANPVVQSLFRPDIKETFLKLKKRISGHSNQQTTSSSHHHVHSETQFTRDMYRRSSTPPAHTYSPSPITQSHTHNLSPSHTEPSPPPTH